MRRVWLQRFFALSSFRCFYSFSWLFLSNSMDFTLLLFSRLKMIVLCGLLLWINASFIGKSSNERIFLDYKMAAVTTTNDTNILFRHQHLIYDPVTLKRFAINSNKLSPNVYQLLKETRLLRPGKRTKRGKRAGVIKVRNYDIITGSNQKNLI